MYKQLYWNHSAQIRLKTDEQNQTSLNRDILIRKQFPQKHRFLPIDFVTDDSSNHSVNVDDDDEASAPQSLEESDSETPSEVQIRASVESIALSVSRFMYNVAQKLKLGCLPCLEVISRIGFDYVEQRESLGNVLVELKFHEYVMSILKQINDFDNIEMNGLYSVLLTTVNICANFTDSSETFSRCLEELEAVEHLTEALKHIPYNDDLDDDDDMFIILTGILMILHNIVRFTGSRTHFHQAKTAEKVIPLINGKHTYLQTLSMILLAYIVEENENDKIIDEIGIINNMITWLHNALNSPERREYGFTPWELTKGLSQLAANNSNKLKIINGGALEEFLKMLSNDDERELENVANCLWKLSLDKEVCQRIKGTPGIVTALEKFQNSNNSEIRRNVEGALWVINGGMDVSVSTENDSNKVAGRHIFISYSSVEKEKVRKIFDSLKSAGFQLWIDFEKMQGSTLSSMAIAVEDASVVLICMSESYKQSPYCQTEAEYTYIKRKPVIPLLMQKLFKPDGWLGALTGAKYFYDFSGKYAFEPKIEQLKKGIRDAMNGVQDPDSNNKIQIDDKGPASIVNMSQEEVIKWLESKGLERLAPAFSKTDGQKLWDMKYFSDAAPEYFYKEFKQTFGVTLEDIIQLHSVFRRLH